MIKMYKNLKAKKYGNIERDTEGGKNWVENKEEKTQRERQRNNGAGGICSVCIYMLERTKLKAAFQPDRRIDGQTLEQLEMKIIHGP